ncbi:MAG: hypothetical protein C0502_05015 [Opitutus sp.]|nr:hypothetical protein [Opitutus sp.]
MKKTSADRTRRYRITLDISEKNHTKLTRAAAAMGMTVNQALNYMLNAWSAYRVFDAAWTEDKSTEHMDLNDDPDWWKKSE